jgi:hypothetical protein
MRKAIYGQSRYQSSLRCLAVLAFLLSATSIYAQETSGSPTPTPPPAPVAQVEDDPTKPIAFSIRNEHRFLRNDAWANTTIFRFDKVTLRNVGNKGGAKGLILRFDIPINTLHSGNTTKTGLGDLYAQALYLPKVSRKFALATGTGIVLPTATSELLGRGKVILSPTVVPVWYFSDRKRFALLRIQNFVSIAGKKDRPDVNYFIAAPAIIHPMGKGWWIVGDTELKWDWKSKKGSGITGLQIGRMIKGKYGIWVKPEVPWGPGRIGNFNSKFTVFKIR